MISEISQVGSAAAFSPLAIICLEPLFCVGLWHARRRTIKSGWGKQDVATMWLWICCEIFNLTFNYHDMFERFMD
jgi:hypothetical protein